MKKKRKKLWFQVKFRFSAVSIISARHWPNSSIMSFSASSSYRRRSTSVSVWSSSIWCLTNSFRCLLTRSSSNEHVYSIFSSKTDAYSRLYLNWKIISYKLAFNWITIHQSIKFCINFASDNSNIQNLA